MKANNKIIYKYMFYLPKSKLCIHTMCVPWLFHTANLLYFLCIHTKTGQSISFHVKEVVPVMKLLIVNVFS